VFNIQDILDILLSNKVNIEDLVTILLSHHPLELSVIKKTSDVRLLSLLTEAISGDDNEIEAEKVLSDLSQNYPLLEKYINKFLVKRGFEVRPGKFDFAETEIIAWSNKEEISINK